MKKVFIRIFSTILCLALLCPLTACSDSAKLLRLEGAERADLFFDLVNESPADTYRTEMEMEMSGSVYGVAFRATGNMEIYYVNYEGNTPTYHAESESIMEMGTGSSATTLTTKSIKGYRDGKMYEYSDEDGVTTALVSAISPEDYKKHIESLSDLTDEELISLHKSATNKQCEQNDDGSWSAVYSGYDEKSVADIVDYCFDSTATILDGYKVKDVILEINATEDFVPTEWRYELVFERTDESNLYKEPKAVTTINFKEIGKVEAPSVDLSTYTEIESLAALREIRNILNDMIVKESGSFTAKSNQNVKYTTTTTNTDETDVVTFNNNNGEYSFNIDANIVAPGMSVSSGADYRLVYKDGELTVSGGGMTPQKQEMTNNEAKIYIIRLLDPAGLSSATVSDMQAGSGNYTYSIVLSDPDYSALEPSLTSLNAKDIKAEASVDVIYEDGVLKEYRYKLTVTSTVNLEPLTIKITSTVTYESNDDAEL